MSGRVQLPLIIERGRALRERNLLKNAGSNYNHSFCKGRFTHLECPFVERTRVKTFRLFLMMNFLMVIRHRVTLLHHHLTIHLTHHPSPRSLAIQHSIALSICARGAAISVSANSGGQSGLRNVGFFLHSRIVGPVLFLSRRLYSFYLNLNLDEAAHTSALPSWNQ